MTGIAVFDWLLHFRVEMAVAAGATVLLWLALRWRLRGGWLLVLACLPVALVLLKADVRTYSYHGLLHVSLVYRLLAGPFPPTDAFFAGEPLTYPWAHHALVGVFARLLSADPFTIFASMNLALLALTVFTLYRTAAELFEEPPARALAVVPALFGLSLFSRGPLWWLLAVKLHFWPVTRVLPVEKFAHVTSNGFGVLFFAIHLLAVVRIFGVRGARWRDGALLGGAVLGAALFYPAAWGAIALSAAASAGVLWWRQPRERAHALLVTAVSGAAGTAIALPYLWLIRFGRNPAAALQWSETAGWVGWKMAVVLVSVSALAVLSWFFRAELRRAIVAAPAVWLVVATTALLNFAMYVAFRATYGNEYKFLLFGSQALGLAAGAPLAALWRKNSAVWFAVVGFWILPAASHGLELLKTTFGDPSRMVADGWVLHQTDPARDRLNQWIRKETARDAAIVDSELSVGPFAHRSLFVVLGREFLPLPDGDTLHGWSLAPAEFLHNLFGHELDSIRHRWQLVLAILDPARPRANDEELRELRELTGASEIYVVVRDRRRQRPLDQDPRFERVYHDPPFAVFELTSKAEGS